MTFRRAPWYFWSAILAPPREGLIPLKEGMFTLSEGLCRPCTSPREGNDVSACANGIFGTLSVRVGTTRMRDEIHVTKHRTLLKK